MLQRERQDGCGSRGDTRGLTSYLDTSRGLITPDWVTWATVYDVERPETPNDP
ncbi:hypothetical protein NFI96_003313, partial [Prochilodus magdalenae]